MTFREHNKNNNNHIMQTNITEPELEESNEIEKTKRHTTQDVQ